MYKYASIEDCLQLPVKYLNEIIEEEVNAQLCVCFEKWRRNPEELLLLHSSNESGACKYK